MFVKRHSSQNRKSQIPVAFVLLLSINSPQNSRTNRKSTYRLWSADMLLAVLSRVRTLDHIIFFGEIDDKMDAIKDLVRKSSNMRNHIDASFRGLYCLNNNPLRVVSGTFTQQLVHVDTNDGFVSMLGSTNDTNVMLILAKHVDRIPV